MWCVPHRPKTFWNQAKQQCSLLTFNNAAAVTSSVPTSSCHALSCGNSQMKAVQRPAEPRERNTEYMFKTTSNSSFLFECGVTFRAIATLKVFFTVCSSTEECKSDHSLIQDFIFHASFRGQAMELVSVLWGLISVGTTKG